MARMSLAGLDRLGCLTEGVQALGARVAEPTHMQAKPAEVGAWLPMSELVYTERVELLESKIRRLISQLEKCFEATRRAVQTDSVWERCWMLRGGQ